MFYRLKFCISASHREDPVLNVSKAASSFCSLFENVEFLCLKKNKTKNLSVWV